MVKCVFVEKIYWGLLLLIVFLSWLIFYVEYWKWYCVQGVVYFISFIVLLFFIFFYIWVYLFEFDGILLVFVRNIIVFVFVSILLVLECYIFVLEDDVNVLVDSMGKGVVLYFGGQDILLEWVMLIDGMFRMCSLFDVCFLIELVIDLWKIGLYNVGVILFDFGFDFIDYFFVYLFEYENLNKCFKIIFYDCGFWLYLSIEFVEDECVFGDIRLCLLDEDQSYFVGWFDVFKKDLVWEIGIVCCDYDFNDIIEYIL